MKRCIFCMKPINDEANFCNHCGNKQNEVFPDHFLPAGSILNGKYMVGASIGAGGFGITYVGWDTDLDYKVAIKEYFPIGIASRNCKYTNEVSFNISSATKNRDMLVNKFKQEAIKLKKCHDQPLMNSIVDVKERFECNNTAYIVMEFLEGETLQDYLVRTGRMRPEDMVSLLTPVMKALARVHSENFIHRDVAADNIMLTRDNRVVLFDFGAVRDVSDDANRSTSIELKRRYAPPEQYGSDEKLDEATDIYALCATMYYCIAGDLPPESISRYGHDTLVRPSAMGIPVPAAIESAIIKGLELNPADRFHSIRDLMIALGVNSADLPPVGPQETTYYGGFNHNVTGSRTEDMPGGYMPHTGRNTVSPASDKTELLDENMAPATGHITVNPANNKTELLDENQYTPATEYNGNAGGVITYGGAVVQVNNKTELLDEDGSQAPAHTAPVNNRTELIDEEPAVSATPTPPVVDVRNPGFYGWQEDAPAKETEDKKSHGLLGGHLFGGDKKKTEDVPAPATENKSGNGEIFASLWDDAKVPTTSSDTYNNVRNTDLGQSQTPETNENIPNNAGTADANANNVKAVVPPVVEDGWKSSEQITPMKSGKRKKDKPVKQPKPPKAPKQPKEKPRKVSDMVMFDDPIDADYGKKTNNFPFALVGGIVGGLLVVGLIVVLLVNFLGKGGKGNDEDSENEVVSTEENEDSGDDKTVTASGQLSFSFSIGSYTYMVPCEMSKFVSDGWTATGSVVLNSSVKSLETETVELVNGNNKIKVTVLNTSSTDKAVQDCTGYAVTSVEGSADKFNVAKGINESSTKADIIAEMGLPTDSYNKTIEYSVLKGCNDCLNANKKITFTGSDGKYEISVTNMNVTYDNDVLEKYSSIITLDGSSFTLPCKLSDFTNAGWNLIAGPGTASISSQTMVSGLGTLEFYVGKGDSRVTLTAYNTNYDSKSISECQIGKISVSKNEVTSVNINGSLTLDATKDEIYNYLGNSGKVESQNGTVEITYQLDKYNSLCPYSEIKFSLYSSGNNKLEITNVNYVDEYVSEVQNDSAPAGMSSYSAPGSKSSDILSGVLSLDNVIYQLPVPVSVFTSNGWDIIQQPGVIPAGQTLKATVTNKDGRNIIVYITNTDTVKHEYSNCVISGVEVSNSQVSVEIPGGVSMTSTLDQLNAFATGGSGISSSEMNNAVEYSYDKTVNNVSVTLAISYSKDSSKVKKIVYKYK